MKLRDNEKADWWKAISKEENESIERGIQDAEAGKLKSHSEVQKLYEKWL
jgi:predicted transcriptional regulator